MKIDLEKIQELISRIELIVNDMRLEEQNAQSELGAVHPDHLESAINLVHYLSFRKFDLRKIQRKLGNLGLTRFANAQGHIMDKLQKTLFLLHLLAGNTSEMPLDKTVTLKKSRKLLQRNTHTIFGEPTSGRRVRIMVTMPTEAAVNYDMVRELVMQGMNCARINCAHDAPDVWERIVHNIRKAAKEVGSEVQIAMDLAGPKIRTGPVSEGPKIKKFKPVRDEAGNTIGPAEIVLVPAREDATAFGTVPVTTSWLGLLRQGDRLQFVDARGKKRKLKVVHKAEEKVYVQCRKTCYIGTGMLLNCKRAKVGNGIVGELPPIQRSVVLHRGETLRVTKEPIPGSSRKNDMEDVGDTPAHIPCQLATVFEYVKAGDRILFDDGKIEGRIQEVNAGYFDVLITRAAINGSKLKGEKGMNFPDTHFGFSELTEKDRVDLDFVAAHADIVNFSFVNVKKDVEELFTALKKRKRFGTIGIILKIETRFAFENLRELLLSVMKVRPIGVMIARGDLAVETGWHSMGKVQNAIIDQCGAAHIPVIWATQVLENMAKNGLPSRSEISDVASSLKTECVMLNKGPFMNEVLPLLGTMLSDMENIQEKTETMLPSMGKL